MDIITFERKGINISLKIKEFSEDNRLYVYWKAEENNVTDGTNKYSSDGFFGNGTFDKYKNAIVLRSGFKVKGIKKIIGGITLEGDVLKYFSETYEKMYAERKELFKNTVKKIISGEIKALCKTQTRSYDGWDMEENRLEWDIDEKLDKYAVIQKALEHFGFDIAQTWIIENWIEKGIKEYKKGEKITLEESLKFRLGKRKEKDDKINALIKKAKETGEKQEIKRWTEECNDKNEECNIDIIYQYAMPDGTIREIRSHTW